LHQNLLTAVKDALNGVIPNEIMIPNKLPEFENPAPPETKPEEATVRDKKN